MTTVPFGELLNKDNAVSIHHRNLQILVKNNLSSTIMSNIFPENNTAYDLRNKREFKTPYLMSLNLKLNIGHQLNASAGYVVFLSGILVLFYFYHWFGGGEGSNLVGDHFNIYLC